MNNHNNLVTLGSTTVAKTARANNDFYATPPIATQKLLDMLESVEKSAVRPDYFLEPCNGMGHISNELLLYKVPVLTQDLIDYNVGTHTIQDWFETKEKPVKGKMTIITNPPYCAGLEFLKHSFDIMENEDYYIFLGRIQFLEGKKRREFFDSNPPKWVFVFSNRINCWKNGVEVKESSAICYAWFVFQKGFKGETKVRWL